MEVSQQILSNLNVKNNDHKQNNANASDKTCEKSSSLDVSYDKSVSENKLTNYQLKTSNDDKEETVSSDNINDDSLHQVLLKSKDEIEINKKFDSNVTELNAVNEKNSQQINVNSQNEFPQHFDFDQIMANNSKQITNILNNIVTFGEREKSQNEMSIASENSSLDIKCQENLVKIMTATDSLKNYEKDEINIQYDAENNGLEEVKLKSVDKIESGENSDFDMIELDRSCIKFSENIIHVSQNKNSQTSDLELNTNKTQNNLMTLNDVSESSQSKSNVDQSISLDNADAEKEKINSNNNTISQCKTNSNLIEINVVSDGSKIDDLVVQEDLSIMKNDKAYRDESSDSWSEDDESSSTSSGSDFFQMVIESSGPKTLPEIKTRGELGLDDLPPIEDLTITVSKDEMLLIGKIHAIVDKLVVVHALKNMKPLDLDSVLFLSHNEPLGRIYDVFGPVVEPFYCVRFNSTDQINEKNIKIESEVFFAPEKVDITSYVFLDELQKEKGSDASWQYNNEPPEEFLDFSDDEQEKVAKKKRINKNRNKQINSSSDVSTKRPFLVRISESQENLNYTSVVCSRPSTQSSLNTRTVSRTTLPSSPYSPHPRPSSSISSVLAAPRFSPSPCPPHPAQFPSSPVSSVFAAPRFTTFSRPYPPHPSPPSSVSSVYAVPFSSPYPSHPPPSPSLSISSVFAASRFTPFSSAYSPSPSPFSTVYSSPLSPTPSICSVMSIPMRAQTSGPLNFSNAKQPRSSYFSHPRLFSPQNTSTLSFANVQQHDLMTSSLQGVLQQPTSPVMPQSHQQSPQNIMQGSSLPPQNLMQRPALPPQNIMQRPALPSQNMMQRPAIAPQNIMQRPAIAPQNVMQRPVFPLQNFQQTPTLPPILPPYDPTHVFGQITPINAVPALQSSLRPSASLQSFASLPANSKNYFPVVNHQDIPRGPPPCNTNAPSNPWPANTSLHSHIPPNHPLTVEIPNSNSPSIPVNPFQPRNDMVWPVVNNINRNGHPALY